MDSKLRMTELIKQDLEQCIKYCLKTYKSLMDDLLKPLQPLKDSQLRDFHFTNLKVIFNAFDNFFMDLTNTSSTASSVFQDIKETRKNLDKLINSQFNEVYLKKHEIQIEDVGKKVKMCTNKAEVLYDEKSQGANINTKEKFNHKALEKEAFTLFHELLKEEKESMLQEEFWNYELNKKLEDRFEDLREEFLKESQPKSEEDPIAEKESFEKHTGKEIPGCSHSSRKDINSIVSSQIEDYFYSCEKTTERKFQELAEFEKSVKLSSQIFTQPLSGVRDVDIGVYLDKDRFSVGTYNTNALEAFKEVLSIPPEIYFSKGSIFIGNNAQLYKRSKNNRFFNVFQLMQEPKPNTFQLPMGQTSFNLCIHEIIAIFFKHVFKCVEIENNFKIKKIIFTMKTLLTSTSALKERIQKSARIAGFSDFHIYSALLTAGVAGLDLFKYFKNIREDEISLGVKHLLVLDYNRYFFSMAVLEISPIEIVLKNQYFSSSISECQKNEFLNYHKHLYERERSLPEESEDNILKIYKDAIYHVLNASGLDLFQVEAVAVSEEKNAGIESIFFDILNEKVKHLNISFGPLFGASMLASFISNDILCNLTPRILVQDSMGFDLQLKIDCGFVKNNITRWGVMGNRIQNIMVFFHEVDILLGNSLSKGHETFPLKLYELLGPNMFKAYRYYISCKYDCVPRIKTFYNPIKIKVGIECWIDNDGVLSLRAGNMSNLPVILELQREDRINCIDGCNDQGSQYIKLLEYYRVQAETTRYGESTLY